MSKMTLSMPQTPRELQVTLPNDVYILLARLVTKRVEEGFAPGKSTKTAVIVDAIRELAKEAGVDGLTQLQQAQQVQPPEDGPAGVAKGKKKKQQPVQQTPQMALAEAIESSPLGPEEQELLDKLLALPKEQTAP